MSSLVNDKIHDSIEPKLCFSQSSYVNSFISILISTAGRLSSLVNFKGFWHAANILGNAVPKNTVSKISLGSKSDFYFDLSDPYWNRLSCRVYKYEQEISDFFFQVKNVKSLVFLDCGSNYGYWSILATDESIGIKDVIAIEASTINYEYLKFNNERNGARFKTINKAIFSESGKTVKFCSDDASHANSKIVAEGEGIGVVTVDIDTIVNQYSSHSPVVIKLDVEGAEIEALRGATQSMSRQFCIIYEDHGNDAKCLVTDWILNNTECAIYWKDNKTQSYKRISSVEDLKPLKIKASVGYNLFATQKGSIFCQEIFER